MSRSGGAPQDDCSSPRLSTDSNASATTPSAAEDLQHYMELEAGERGKLHPMYANQILDWMEAVAADNPSDKNLGWNLYFKQKYELKSDVSINSFLELAVRCFHQAISKGNIFQQVPLPDGSEEWELKRLGASSSNERPLSGSAPGPQSRRRPGSSQRFLLVGRNYQHWCRYMSSRGLLELGRPTSLSDKVWHDVRSHQRLTGYEGSHTGLPNYCKMHPEENVLIPRQILCLLHVNGRRISFYSYNFSKDTNTKIAEQLSSLVDWHNSRFRLFTSIVRQKLGVFQGMEETYSSFNSYERAKHLIMMASPPAQTPPVKPSTGSHLGHFSRFTASQGLSSSTASHQTSQDSKASNTGFKSFHLTLHSIRWSSALPAVITGHQLAADIIQRHGQHVFMARKYESEKDKERNDLEDMARRWYLKMATTGVAPERLTRMKSFCRLLHTVTSPLLFHPDMGILRRHSGASQGSGRSSQSTNQGIPTYKRKLSLVGEKKSPSSPEQKIQRHNSDGTVAQVNRSSYSHHKLLDRMQSEDDWVCRLKMHLLMQYEQYLIRKLHFNETVPRNRQDTTFRTPYSLLYKSNFGGAIILVELLFRGAYFSVRVGAVEHQRLCLRFFRGNTTRETRLAFVDETDRLCHLTHLSSFVHDFYLRSVAHHIMSERLPTPWLMSSTDSATETIRNSPLATLVCNEEVASLLRPHYHIIGFLERMLAATDGRPPLYSTNFLVSWSYRVDCNPTCCVVGDKLFDYILNHDHIYGLRNLPMTSMETISNGEEYCLVDKENLSDTSTDLHSPLREFTCYTLITKESKSELNAPENGLGLRLFFLLINTKQPFPISSLERCRVSNKERRLVAVRPCLLMSHGEAAGMSEVNYLGWDARLQRQILDFLPQQKGRWRERLNRLVSHAASRAHKDNLWSRLFGVLLSPSLVPQSSVISDTSTSGMLSSMNASLSDSSVQLQLSALREIMDMGTVLDLNEMDTRLAETLNFSASYHDMIMSQICQRFPTHSALFKCRQVDERVCDLSAAVVLIHPSYRKAFLLITQRYIHQSVLTLKAVFQEEADPKDIYSVFYDSPLVHLVHAVAEISCFILWRKLHN